MKKVALIGGLLALVGAGSAFGAGQFPGYPLLGTITGFEYVPADTGLVATRATFTGSIAGTALTSSTSTGIAIGQNIVGAGVAPGTVITGGSGTSWTVSPSQTVGPVAMTSGGAGVNPQTAMIQTQALKAYTLTNPVVTGAAALAIPQSVCASVTTPAAGTVAIFYETASNKLSVKIPAGTCVVLTP